MLNSLLDNDLYKFSMQQAVCQLFPNAQAKYKFINRGEHKFTLDEVQRIRTAIKETATLEITDDEKDFLYISCPFLTPVYLDFLKGFKYSPKQEISLSFDETDGSLDITVHGPWYKTILWEVPLMAIISEAVCSQQKPVSLDSDLQEAEIRTVDKANLFESKNIKFADFGTRRRYSAEHHKKVVEILNKTAPNNFVGTSNLLIAMENNIKPIGTQAHEWFMFHGAKYGYRIANEKALENWVRVYQGDLGIALSDTYTTDEFFKAFGTKYGKLFDGIRQDSGDPTSFLYRTIQHYNRLGIDPSTKTIVFSDGLTPEKADMLNTSSKEAGIKCSFGIGTNLTNDIPNIKSMNMVVKMSECMPCEYSKWLPTVKLSDSPGKWTGNDEEIEICRKTIR